MLPPKKTVFACLLFELCLFLLLPISFSVSSSSCRLNWYPNLIHFCHCIAHTSNPQSMFPLLSPFYLNFKFEVLDSAGDNSLKLAPQLFSLSSLSFL